MLSPLPVTAPELEPAVWYFGDFVLDLPCFELRHNGVSIRMEPQVFDVLTLLVQHHHRVVTKNELFDTVWGGRFVGEAALSSRIKAVRRALGDDGESQHYIRTVRGRGYQFVGDLIDPDTDRVEDITEVDVDAGVSEPETVPHLAIAGGSGRILHHRSRRSRGLRRSRDRVAPSTRRREFNGPPK